MKAKIIVTLYIKNVTGALYTVNYNEREREREREKREIYLPSKQ